MRGDEEDQGLLGPPMPLPGIRPSPSCSSGRALGANSPSSCDAEADKLSFVSGCLEPPPERRGSNHSREVPDNGDTFGPGGLDPRALLQERPPWRNRYLVKESRRAGKATFQGHVYNFLERPTGWKCFTYHITV